MDCYLEGLQRHGPQVTDFAGLEQQFLEQLTSQRLSGFISRLRAIFVDEFQDTNTLQEAIYYQLAADINGAITIVGDDDQSLYRFRGGTVELFRNARSRMIDAFPADEPAAVRHLSTNYRAQRMLVDFSQDFIECDNDYQFSRVSDKPRVRCRRGSDDGLPVLGLFRDDVDELASDLATLIGDLFNGQGISILSGNQATRVSTGPNGQPGDCAFLAHSVREYAREFRGQRRKRFPLFLRWRLASLDPAIRIFNPRGQILSMVPEIAQLCGLMLECIDPDSRHERSIVTLLREAREVFRMWRNKARALVARNPYPNSPTTLGDFLRSWQRRQPQIQIDWPSELPLIDLCYQLLTWVPSLQDDPERQIHLEVVARAITETTMLGGYRSRIVFDDPAREHNSIVEAIRHVFTPIALGDIEINEDIIETFPRTAVNVLTVHQAKGLEFPVVVVDVGTDFKIDHERQRAQRFPDRVGETYLIEDNALSCSSLNAELFRSGMDRAFDDLTRLYYVAYSRAQSLLVLVGLNSVLPERRIRHVAMGWTRTGTSSWRHNCPFLTI